ncbi:MAG: hypothetical protein WCP20_19095 [Desulfuromonadales bacterium]
MDQRVNWKRLFGPGMFVFIGSCTIGESFLIPPSSGDYEKRWLVCLVGLMVIAIGAAFYLQKYKYRLSKEVETMLGSALSVIVFGVFATVFLAGASLFGDEIRGGIPFLPSGVNNVIGRILFGLVGGVVAVMTIAQAIKLVILIVKLMGGKR